jgi:hypothetical protein
MSGLDDAAFVDPTVKQKAQNVLNESRERQRENELLEKFRRELTPEKPQPKAEVSDAAVAFESEWEDRIRDEGFDPDGEEWQAVWPQAGAVLRNGGTLADARNVMKAHLKQLKDERLTARKRQAARQNAGGGTPRGVGTPVDILNDPNKSREEKAAFLRSQGITVGYY